MTDIRIKVLDNGKGLPLPVYGTEQSAGADLAAAIDKDIHLIPGERAVVPCGIAIALPHNFEAQIRSRSGLSAKQGLIVLNAPGTIDADYRGEIKAIMINMGEEDLTITRGMRIAQMVIAPVVQAKWQETSDISEDETIRGLSGFGSTGV